jgi:hypothetical protein
MMPNSAPIAPISNVIPLRKEPPKPACRCGSTDLRRYADGDVQCCRCGAFDLERPRG